MSKFCNGDYVRFVETKEKIGFFDRLFKSKKVKYYICSYINQGDIKHQHELKNGEIYRVRHNFLSLLAIEIVDSNFLGDVTDLYFTSTISDLKWELLDKKELKN